MCPNLFGILHITCTSSVVSKPFSNRNKMKVICLMIKFGVSLAVCLVAAHTSSPLVSMASSACLGIGGVCNTLINAELDCEVGIDFAQTSCMCRAR